jgi:hypothetical protein
MKLSWLPIRMVYWLTCMKHHSFPDWSTHEAMEKPGARTQLTFLSKYRNVRERNDNLSVMKRGQTLMDQHQALMDHHQLVQGLYQTFLKSALKTKQGQQQALQNFQRELQKHHQMIAAYNAVVEEQVE